MINETRLKTLLEKSPFAAAELCSLDVPESPEALAIKVPAHQENALWQFLHERIAETERWPLLTALWGAGGQAWPQALQAEELFSRFPYENELQAVSLSAAQILEQAEQLDIAQALQGLETEQSLEDLLAAPETQRPEPLYTEHLEWFEPQEQDRFLLLMPHAQSWAAPAYMHWYGAELGGSVLAVAMLKHWQAKFGAELVAHYGTMLQLQVKTRPHNYREALELAWQQEALAPCTLALPGVELFEHAWALLEVERWFLHERP